ncbi:MAG: GNAT family N-acetyltransferase [Acidobacteriales bacterium]|nr:GNAT family N-acetyltransferase [Terriglobales bacterium]
MQLFQLETDRLILRPVRTLDAPQLLHLWNDPGVRRYLWDDRLIGIDEVQVQINRSLAGFELYGFGLFLIHGRDDEAVRGFCGLRIFGEPAEIELLIALYPQFWKQGLAQEAARAILRFGFEECHLPAILAGHGTPNSESSRLIERLGMKPFGQRTLANGLAAEFAALQAGEIAWGRETYTLRKESGLTPASGPAANS